MSSAASTEARRRRGKPARSVQGAERERIRSAPKFIADAMLGSLARKLRIFGFDTLYFKEGSDASLKKVAKLEKRIILTSDESLASQCRRRGLAVIEIEGRTDRARLLSVLSREGHTMARLMGTPSLSRCAVCNGELKAISRTEAASLGVPPKVLPRHRLFFRCTSCSRLYWRGRHWERLRKLSYSLKTKALT